MERRPVKQCTKCGETKPLEGFYREPRKLDGRCADCKVCRRVANRKFYEKNKERIQGYHRDRYAKDSEFFRAKSRKWVEEHSEENRERSAKWREDNLAYAKQRGRDYARAHCEEGRKRAREWAAKNPEKVAEQSKKQRIKRKGVESDGHTIAELRAYWEKVGYDPRVCSYCDGPISNWKTSVGDHVVPLSRGGPDFVENIVPCCPSCNREKASQLLHVGWTPPNLRAAA